MLLRSSLLPKMPCFRNLIDLICCGTTLSQHGMYVGLNAQIAIRGGDTSICEDDISVLKARPEEALDIAE